MTHIIIVNRNTFQLTIAELCGCYFSCRSIINLSFSYYCTAIVLELFILACFSLRMQQASLITATMSSDSRSKKKVHMSMNLADYRYLC